MVNEKKVTIETSISKDQLEKFLHKIEKDFVPNLSSKVSLSVYAKKLTDYAKFFVALSGSEIIGLIAFYCNDVQKKNAYISMMGISRRMRDLGIGSKLIKLTTNFIRTEGFETLNLETWEGSQAQVFYEKFGFRVIAKIPDRINGIRSIKMRCWISNANSNLDLIKTPLHHLYKIGNNFNINLFAKRDDLYTLSGGGNKARKLTYILNTAVSKGFNAIVTAGSSQSNHLRATALNAAKLGWKTIFIVHDTKPDKKEGNLKILNLMDSELRFVQKEDVKVAMDGAMQDLTRQGFKPLYIWGGGHCLEGSFAYYEAVKELNDQLGNIHPEYIVVASGTGTTQAGIEIGVRQFFPGCKVLGISVARTEKRGKDAILESMKELNDFLKNPVKLPCDIIFDDRWIGEGYEATYPELLETINWAAKTEGLILDPTYTGKAFHALIKYVEDGTIPKNSNVIFWHTGGLLNLMASNKI